MKMALDTVSQHKLYIEVVPNHQTKKASTFGRKVSLVTESVVAFEHRAALIGMNVHPAARSDTANENMNRVVRSSRS